MSRDPERISELLAALRRVLEANPDWRLGQIISNATRRDALDWMRWFDPFYIEDDKMLTALNSLTTPKPPEAPEKPVPVPRADDPTEVYLDRLLAPGGRYEVPAADPPACFCACHTDPGVKHSVPCC